MTYTNARWLLTLVLLGVSGGCGSQTQDPGTGSREKVETQRPAYDAKKTAPPKALSADAEAPTGEPKDKEKRGNTPPGADRAGNAPVSGAIVDPQGATQK